MIMDLVLLKETSVMSCEKMMVFAVAPFVRLECGDIVKLDKKIGIFEVVRRAMLLDDEHCQMIMEFCGAGDASEMPRVIGKWVNMGDQYDV